MASSSKTSTMSKGFFQFVKSIGETKSKQEEDGIIKEELQTLKAKMNGRNVPPRNMREYLIRMVLVEILGHNASFGYIHAVKLSRSNNLINKRVGYMACSLCLHKDHELILLLIGGLQTDLESQNILQVSTALIVACKLINEDTIPAILPLVNKLLHHKEATIRKKAIMVIQRFHELSSSSVTNISDKVKRMLCDKDPAVMGASLHLLLDLIHSNELDCTGVDLVPSIVSILKQIIEHRLPKDYEYGRVPAPWMQIKLLRILAALGTANKSASQGMYEVLAEVMRRADIGINVGYAIVYECVATVTTIYPNAQLLADATKYTSRFITSEYHNLKYLGINALASIIQIKSPNVMQQMPSAANIMKKAVSNCLDDKDETLRQTALDLFSKMTNVNSQNEDEEDDQDDMFGGMMVNDEQKQQKHQQKIQIKSIAELNELSEEEKLTLALQMSQETVQHNSDIQRSAFGFDLNIGGGNNANNNNTQTSAFGFILSGSAEDNTNADQDIFGLGPYGTGNDNAKKINQKPCDVNIDLLSGDWNKQEAKNTINRNNDNEVDLFNQMGSNWMDNNANSNDTQIPDSVDQVASRVSAFGFDLDSAADDNAKKNDKVKKINSKPGDCQQHVLDTMGNNEYEIKQNDNEVDKNAVNLNNGPALQFEKFLKQHRLQRYYQSFKQNECDDIRDIEYLIDQEEFIKNDIGMVHPIDRKRFLGESKKLKMQMDSFKNNGMSSTIMQRLSDHGIVTMHILRTEIQNKSDLSKKYHFNTKQTELIWNIIEKQENLNNNNDNMAMYQQEGSQLNAVPNETAYI